MIRFTVAGQPGTKGSSKAFIVPPINTLERIDKARANMARGGNPPRAIITNDAGESAKTWASVVSDAARVALDGGKLLEGPLGVHVKFYLQRPRAHYRPNGPLRPNAPTHVATRPDIDKYLRSTLDALTGVLFTDDSQVALLLGEKLYTNDGRTGAVIEVATLDDARPVPAPPPPALLPPQQTLPLDEEL